LKLNTGGRTAAVVRFVASGEAVNVDLRWFKVILDRAASYSIDRITGLLPHNWTSAQTLPQAELKPASQAHSW
jgi:hypothetical protein